MTCARPEGAGACAARKRGAHMGGFEGGATAPPRGALGAEPQAKIANLPIKHAFSHQKRGLRTGWKGNPGRDLGPRWRSEDWDTGATKRTCTCSLPLLVSSFCLFVLPSCRRALVLSRLLLSCVLLSTLFVQIKLNLSTNHTNNTNQSFSPDTFKQLSTLRSPQGASSARAFSAPPSSPHAIASSRR